jgi:cell shape-determining protein MreC
LSRKKVFLYIVVVSIIFLVSMPFFVLEFKTRILFVDGLKIKTREMVESFSSTMSIITDLKNVGKKNIELEKEISELKVRLIMNEAIKKENEELSKLLKIKDSYSSYSIIPAKILNYSAINPNMVTISYPPEYTKIMSEKATVVSSLGLVGLVSSFHGTQAEVELITSKQFTIPAVLENREECNTILRGNGQSLSILFLDKICSGESTIGKKLLSANLSENYSIPHIPIGIVGSLKEDESNILLMKGEAIPLFKKGKLTHIFIIIGTNIESVS